MSTALFVLTLSLGVFLVLLVNRIRATPVRPQPRSESSIMSFEKSQDGVNDTQGNFVPVKSKQPYDAFLVVDVEGTCCQEIPFGYPNEIIVRQPLGESNRLIDLSIRNGQFA
jgi:hypothetical protein